MPAPTLRVGTTKGEGPGGRTGGASRALLEDRPVNSPEHSPPWWSPGVWENKEAEPPFLEFDLELPPELGPNVNCTFSRSWPAVHREDSRNNSSPEPLVEEYERLVT